jgi:D-3-phosphoglycerate dehydrogenase
VTTAIRIAVDLDGVLTEHPRPLAQAANQRYGLDLPDHAFIDSAGLNVPLEVRCWVYGAHGPARALRAAPGAQDFLREILALFGADNVQIVTARPDAFRGTTLDWLKERGFPTCHVVFAEDKVAVARQLGVTHALEDSLRHAACYAASGVRCILLADGPASPDEPHLISRVPDLEAAQQRFRQEAGLAGGGTARRADDLSVTGPGAQTTREANGAMNLEYEVLSMTEGAGATATRRKRIVVSDMIDSHAREVLSREADLIDVDGTNPEALAEVLRDADALIVRSETQVTREVLSWGPKLRVVARAGVGVDNIDVPSATEAGILVLNAPGANAVSAGEHTIALLLAIARCIPQANASTHDGRWERKRFKPFDLRDKTVGIVGLGRVGSVVAQRLRGFEMRLIGYDPYITRERFAQLGVEPVAYETLLERADVVTFHVPSTDETVNMLDADAIARMKPSAIVLNCARGDVVDDDALAVALRVGRLAAAGVDVFPHEPARDNPLFGLPNAVLTPHIGGSSAEALAAVGEVISTTTLAALRGQAVPNAVNLPPASLNAPDLQRLTHVAGAAGHLLAVLRPQRPHELKITVQGLVPNDIVEHVTVAALSDALRRWTDRRVTPVNARFVAEELDLRVTIAVGDADPARTPEFTFEVNGVAPHRVTVRWDRKDAGIMEVDRFSLERPLAGDVLITHHRDRPGIVGRIGTILGAHRVNIAGMQVGRHERGGEAIMVMNVDDAIPDAALSEIITVGDVETAYVVSLPPALRPVAVSKNGAFNTIG